MITRFRIEGQGPTKEAVIEELSSMTAKIISTISKGTTLYEGGMWECTDDVVSPNRKIGEGYKGRMVLQFQEGRF